MQSDAVIGSQVTPVTSEDVVQQRLRRPERSVRDEEAAGSNPATPTTNYQFRDGVLDRTPTLIPFSGAPWRNSGEDLGLCVTALSGAGYLSVTRRSS